MNEIHINLYKIEYKCYTNVIKTMQKHKHWPLFCLSHHSVALEATMLAPWLAQDGQLRPMPPPASSPGSMASAANIAQRPAGVEVALGLFLELCIVSYNVTTFYNVTCCSLL